MMVTSGVIRGSPTMPSIDHSGCQVRPRSDDSSMSRLAETSPARSSVSVTVVQVPTTTAGPKTVVPAGTVKGGIGTVTAATATRPGRWRRAPAYGLADFADQEAGVHHEARGRGRREPQALDARAGLPDPLVGVGQVRPAVHPVERVRGIHVARRALDRLQPTHRAAERRIAGVELPAVGGGDLGADRRLALDRDVLLVGGGRTPLRAVRAHDAVREGGPRPELDQRPDRRGGGDVPRRDRVPWPGSA